jgi:hypothetical protein
VTISNSSKPRGRLCGNPRRSARQKFAFAASTESIKCSEKKVGMGELAVTDAIPMGISVLAPDGTTLYVNRLALDRIGVPWTR